jgi:hypothetical protein
MGSLAIMSPRAVAWPSCESELRDLLGIDPATRLACQGYTIKNESCKTKISADSSVKIRLILRAIVAIENFARSEEFLRELSELVLCKASHQWQIDEKLSKWSLVLRPLQPAPNAGCSRCSIVKPLPRHTVRMKIKPDPTITEEESNKPRPLGPATQIRESTKEEVKEESDNIASIPLFPAQERTRRTTRGARSRASTIQDINIRHEFQRYKESCTSIIANNEVKTKLQSTPSVSETSQEGWLYGYTFPLGHASYDKTSNRSSSLVKIGYSSNVPKRMGAIQGNCEYQPKLLFSFKMPYYKRFEGIVHRHFRKERRREISCPGCNKNHVEWFEIDFARAREVVEMWQQWALQHPFDEMGRLKVSWRSRLKSLDMNDPDCWEKFVGEIKQ